jgi:hypothetical protein
MDEAQKKWGFLSADKRLQEYFIYSVGVLFFMTALLRVIVAVGSNRLLGYVDPLLHLTNRNALLAEAGLEFALSAYLLMGQNRWLRLMLTIWLSTVLIGHHLALTWYSGPYPLSCLGNITDWCTVSPRILDKVWYAVYGLPLGGSYLAVVLNSFERRARVASPAVMPAVKHNEGGA